MAHEETAVEATARLPQPVDGSRTAVLPAADPYGEFRSTSRFGSLDGLRCLSIVAVIWHHGPGHHYHGLLAQGYLGVDLFFAISGFLITTLLLRERDRYGDISLKNFYIRRSLRIFPAYYTMLGIYIVLIAAMGADTAPAKRFFSNVPYFLTYTSNWFRYALDAVPDSTGRAAGVTFGFAWSLASEEQFYAFWPWIERYLPGRRPVYIALFMIAMVLALGIIPGLTGWTQVRTWLVWRIPARIPLGICFGILVAHTLHSRSGFVKAWKMFGWKWASLVMATLVLATIALDLPRALTNLCMALLVCTCVIREDHVLSRFLTLRAVVHIGMVSYGMYLCNGLIHHILRAMPVIKHLHPLLEFPLAVAVTVGVATLSFKYYEGFFLNLKDRFVRVRST